MNPFFAMSDADVILGIISLILLGGAVVFCVEVLSSLSHICKTLNHIANSAAVTMVEIQTIRAAQPGTTPNPPRVLPPAQTPAAAAYAKSNLPYGGAKPSLEPPPPPAQASMAAKPESPKPRCPTCDAVIDAKPGIQTQCPSCQSLVLVPLQQPL